MTTTRRPTTRTHETLIGNLTADPEQRWSNRGNPWTTAPLAVNQRTRQDDGSWAEQPTVFYELICFGELADHVARLAKGDRILAIGRIEEDHWTGNDGTERVTLKVIAEDVGASLRYAPVSVGRPVPAGGPRHTDEGVPDEPF